MKNLFFYSLLILSLINHSNASSLVPLEQYCKENNIKEDISALGYVFLRCSALFLCVAVMIDKRIDKHGDIKGEGGKELVEQYLNYATLLASLSGKALKEKPEGIMKIQKDMILAYAEDGNSNYAKTGSYFQNSYMLDDRRICSDLLSDLIKK